MIRHRTLEDYSGTISRFFLSFLHLDMAAKKQRSTNTPHRGLVYTERRQMKCNSMNGSNLFDGKSRTDTQTSSSFAPSLSERVKMRKRNTAKKIAENSVTNPDQFLQANNGYYDNYGLDEELVLPNKNIAPFVEGSSVHHDISHPSISKSAFSVSSSHFLEAGVPNKAQVKGDATRKDKEALAIVKGQQLFQRPIRISHLQNNGNFNMFNYDTVNEISDSKSDIVGQIMGGISPSSMSQFTVVPQPTFSISEVVNPEVKTASNRKISLQKKPTSLMSKTRKESHCFRRNMQIHSKKKAHVTVIETIPKVATKVKDHKPVMKKNNKSISKRQASKKTQDIEKKSFMPPDVKNGKANQPHFDSSSYKIPKLELPLSGNSSAKRNHISKTQDSLVPKSLKKVHVASERLLGKSHKECRQSGKNTSKPSRTRKSFKRRIFSDDDASDTEDASPNKKVEQIHQKHLDSKVAVNVKSLNANENQRVKDTSDKQVLEKVQKHTEDDTSDIIRQVNSKYEDLCPTEVEVEFSVDAELHPRPWDHPQDNSLSSSEKGHSPVNWDVECEEKTPSVISEKELPSVQNSLTTTNILVDGPDCAQDDCIIVDTIPKKNVPELICLSDDDDVMENVGVGEKHVPLISPNLETVNSGTGESSTTASVAPNSSEFPGNNIDRYSVQRETATLDLIYQFTNFEKTDAEDLAKTLTTFTKSRNSDCPDPIQHTSLDAFGSARTNTEYSQKRQTDSTTNNSYFHTTPVVNQLYLNGTGSYEMARITLNGLNQASNLPPASPSRTLFHGSQDLFVNINQCVVCGKAQPSFCVTCQKNCCFNSVCLPKHRRNCQKSSR